MTPSSWQLAADICCILFVLWAIGLFVILGRIALEGRHNGNRR